MYLEKPDEIEAKGGYVPGGILLWGPPGTGKTLMAEAVAGETGRPYVFVDPGAFINMFFCVGILKVKSLFRKLRKLALRYGGVIVFFDEADSLGNRGMPAQVGPGGPTGRWMTPFNTSCHGTAYLADDTRLVPNFPTSATNPAAPTQTTNVLFNRVMEISTTNNALLNNWALIDMLNPVRISYLTFTIRNGLGWDCEHANAVIEDPRDNSIIVSMRHQNAVIKFSRATGQLKWILGPH